ncbi:MAG: EAL domain-containing protein [Kineosporiaceae bacterium]
MSTAPEDGALVRRRPPAVVTVYAVGVVILSAVIFGVVAARQISAVDWVSPELVTCYLLAGLLVLGELRPVHVARADGDTDQVTVSTTFALALVLCGPLSLALLVQGLAVAAGDALGGRQRLRAAFNVAQYVLTLTSARAVYCLMTGVGMLDPTTTISADRVFAALAAGVTFFVVNNGAVALAVALQAGRSALAVIEGDLRAQGLTSVILIGLAPVAAMASRYSVMVLGLVALPLVGVQRNAGIAAQRQYEALHDGLTGLANRTLFRMRADRALTQARAAGGVVGVMLLDLDHFKDVNDTLGHHVGDALLREVAARVSADQPDAATVARLGGDEFAMVIGPVAEPEQVRALAARISGRLRDPVVVDDVRIGIGASIGIALSSDHEATTDTLLQRADIALYQAKNNRGDVQVYSPEYDQNTVMRLALMADLAGDGVPEGFGLVFQPQIETATGRVVCLEALMRWRHPVHGPIEPEVFIPLAENCGAIRNMSHRAVEESLRALDRLRTAGHDLSMAVNVSVRLLQDLEVPTWVREVLHERSVPAERLTLEVTESTLLADPRRALGVLRELRELGVRLAVDDFGTGYSSLSYLQQLRPDDLKVDKSFVTHMLADENDEVIVRSTIELAHGLGLTVVAEGVEDLATMGRLATLGCDRVQGFHIARPMSEESLLAWLDARRASEVSAAIPRQGVRS